MGKPLQYLNLILILASCVEPIRLPELSGRSVLVVDGMITDEADTHSVVLSFSGAPDQDLDKVQRLTGAAVTIVNDLGEEYVLIESEDGVYQTAPDFRGIPGRTYQLKISAPDGTQYESVPSLLQPGGAIDSVYQELRENVINQNDLTLPQDALYLYIKATASANATLLRWRWRATYYVRTFPELVTKMEDGQIVPAPLPCSGYINENNKLVPVRDCECCHCWPEMRSANVSISQPRGDQQHFVHQYLGRVPLEEVYFYDKMVVQVEQLTVSEDVYNFWKLAKVQTESAGDIFQPNIVKVRGNMKNVTQPNQDVFGVFAVSSVVKNELVITRGDIPKQLPEPDTVTADCRRFFDASNQRPPFW